MERRITMDLTVSELKELREVIAWRMQTTIPKGRRADLARLSNRISHRLAILLGDFEEKAEEKGAEKGAEIGTTFSPHLSSEKPNARIDYVTIQWLAVAGALLVFGINAIALWVLFVLGRVG